jgi:predicted membrane-bound spermidine synthase
MLIQSQLTEPQLVPATKFKALLIAVSAAFFLSGAAALAYQIAWQRLLFAAFGVDIESVTVIVSIFMLGLGIGGYTGGVIADRYCDRVAVLFCTAELLIGLFGLFSVGLINWVATNTSGASLTMTAFWVFLLLGIPTFLMGATLPMLVSFLARNVNEYAAKIGVATGKLYFINTLGAALGAFLTGFVLLNFINLQQVVWLAASANFVSSAFMFIVVRRVYGK